MTRRRRWVVLATVAASVLLITLDNTILYTALPTLTEELGATGSQALWIVNAYPLVMAGLLLGSGTLGDQFGHRRMFLIGLVIFGLSSFWAAFSLSAESMIAAPSALAVGAAGMMPATLALIRVTFHIERERNFAIAVWGSISVVGAALGPIAGGLLLEYCWRGSVFLINVPVVVAALIAGVVVISPSAPAPSEQWDLMSSIQVMVGLVGSVLFIKELAHTSINWAVLIGAAAAATVGFFLFTRRQGRLKQPLLDFAIFRNRAFTSGALTAVMVTFAIGGVQLLTTQRFQLLEGVTPLEAGVLVAAIAVGSLPTTLLGGAFLHRTGLLVLITGGLTMAAGGVVVIIFGVQTDAFGLLVAGLLVTGAGLGAGMSVASTAIVGNVPSGRAGMASSVEEVAYEFGSLSAVAVLGSLVTFVYASIVHLPPGAPEVAGESLADALAVAEGNRAITSAANSAFDAAYLIALIIVAVVLTAGAGITGRMLRHYKPGTSSQAYSEESSRIERTANPQE